MNTHTLTYIALLVITNQLPQEALCIWLFNSQTCESMFRAARSMSGSFSSVVNFSVADFIRRAEKLSVLETIKTGAESNSEFPFRFPRHHKQPKFESNSTSTLHTSRSLLSSSELERIVKRSFNDALEIVAPLGINILDNNGNLATLNEVSMIVKIHLEKTSMINSSNQQPVSDSSSESDDELSSFELQDTESSSNSDDNQDSNPECLSNVSNYTFRGMRVYDGIKPSHTKSYFKVKINGQTKFLHKQTACWLLMHEKLTLSSDRLRRVMMNK